MAHGMPNCNQGFHRGKKTFFASIPAIQLRLVPMLSERRKDWRHAPNRFICFTIDLRHVGCHKNWGRNNEQSPMCLLGSFQHQQMWSYPLCPMTWNQATRFRLSALCSVRQPWLWCDAFWPKPFLRLWNHETWNCWTGMMATEGEKHQIPCGKLWIIMGCLRVSKNSLLIQSDVLQRPCRTSTIYHGPTFIFRIWTTVDSGKTCGASLSKKLRSASMICFSGTSQALQAPPPEGINEVFFPRHPRTIHLLFTKLKDGTNQMRDFSCQMIFPVFCTLSDSGGGVGAHTTPPAKLRFTDLVEDKRGFSSIFWYSSFHLVDIRQLPSLWLRWKTLQEFSAAKRANICSPRRWDYFSCKKRSHKPRMFLVSVRWMFPPGIFTWENTIRTNAIRKLFQCRASQPVTSEIKANLHQQLHSGPTFTCLIHKSTS